MPNARTRAAQNSGSTVSTMSLSNPSQGAKATAGKATAAAATAPRKSVSQRTKPQDDPQTLAGVILTGQVITDRPKSSGRGRQANPVDPEFAAKLAQTLAGGSVLHVGDPNALNREVKNFATKWIEQNGGKAAVTVRYVTDKTRTAQLTKADIDALVADGQERDKIVVTAYFAEKKETAAA